MITTLRNPLELFVSALQFKNREDTRTLNGAVELASQNMQTSLRCVLPHLHHAWYAEGSLYMRRVGLKGATRVSLGTQAVYARRY